ncbi:MAG TPA: hypothetical protein VGL75_12615 [Acidothermaceae bacterium]
MKLDTYQVAASQTDALDPGGDDPLVSLLGLGAHVGDLLNAQKQYLRSSLDLSAATTLMRQELGDVLWYLCAVARRHDLKLSEIARANLVKTRERAAARGNTGVTPAPTGSLSFAQYQQSAVQTDEEIDNRDVMAITVPLLGLIGEAGNLLNAQKKYYTDREPTTRDRGFIRTELGDLLWYLSVTASHCDLPMEDVAAENLVRVRRYDPTKTNSELPADSPSLDAEYPDTERFPRRVVIRFQPVRTAAADPKRAKMLLVEASPNAFPQGPNELASTARGKKRYQGFAVGKQLGDQLTDNSPNSDAYRFHDAIHLGFLAVLGWSATCRGLLRLKRRSDEAVDENEDGARAVFAEEGIAALLAKRSIARGGFLTELSVDTNTLEIVTTVFEDLEVAVYPPWAWRRAISQGFVVMQQLSQNRGSGYVVADLDQHALTYSKTPPAPVRPLAQAHRRR